MVTRSPVIHSDTNVEQQATRRVVGRDKETVATGRLPVQGWTTTDSDVEGRVGNRRNEEKAYDNHENDAEDELSPHASEGMRVGRIRLLMRTALAGSVMLTRQAFS